MPIRGPLVRSAAVLGAVVGGALALAGALAIRGPGLTAVGVAGLFAACLCAGVAREEATSDLRSTFNAALHGAAWTVFVLLAVAGAAGLIGGVVTALLVGTALLCGAAIWLVHAARADRLPTVPDPAPSPGVGPAAVGPPELLTPVPELSTRALGQEWLSTSRALAGRLEPAARTALVRRREETLDELERRDPDGFARWMIAGPVPGSDPAAYVRRDRTAGTDAA